MVATKIPTNEYNKFVKKLKTDNLNITNFIREVVNSYVSGEIEFE